MEKNWIHKFKLKIRHFDNKVLFNFYQKYLENKAIPIRMALFSDTLIINLRCFLLLKKILFIGVDFQTIEARLSNSI